MPDPEVIRAVARLRAALLRLDAQSTSALVRSYGPIWQRLEAELKAILPEVGEKQLSFVDFSRLERVKALQRQVRREVTQWADVAEGRVTEAQRASVGLAQDGTRRTVDAALPPGINTRVLARAGITWNTLPAEAFEVMVGLAGDGSPLSRLLAPLGPEAQVGVMDALKEGIALGKGPIQTAALVRRNFGLPLTRALTISRTETLRAYREASRMQYQANRAVVKGWRRLAVKDERTCMICITLDGQEYDTDDPGDLHPNCRCSFQPITVSYADLGLDVPEPPDEYERAAAWFGGLDADTQQEMMGRARFESWRGGVALRDMITTQPNSIWGRVAILKPVGAL